MILSSGFYPGHLIHLRVWDVLEEAPLISLSLQLPHPAHPLEVSKGPFLSMHCLELGRSPDVKAVALC
jgi:hypothetical protein